MCRKKMLLYISVWVNLTYIFIQRHIYRSLQTEPGICWLIMYPESRMRLESGDTLMLSRETYQRASSPKNGDKSGVQKTLQSNLAQNGDLNTMFLAKIKSNFIAPIAEIPSQPGKQENHNLDKQTNKTLIQMNNEQCNKINREDGDDSSPSSRPGEYQHCLFTRVPRRKYAFILILGAVCTGSIMLVAFHDHKRNPLIFQQYVHKTPG